MSQLPRCTLCVHELHIAPVAFCIATAWQQDVGCNNDITAVSSQCNVHHWLWFSNISRELKTDRVPSPLYPTHVETDHTYSKSEGGIGHSLSWCWCNTRGYKHVTGNSLVPLLYNDQRGASWYISCMPSWLCLVPLRVYDPWSLTTCPNALIAPPASSALCPVELLWLVCTVPGFNCPLDAVASWSSMVSVNICWLPTFYFRYTSSFDQFSYCYLPMFVWVHCWLALCAELS